MELNSGHEGTGSSFNCFNDTVPGSCGNPEAFSRFFYCLMMERIHHGLFAKHGSQETIFFNRDDMGRRISRCRLYMFIRTFNLCTQVLIQSTAAGNIQNLDALADAEYRNIFLIGFMNDTNIEIIYFLHGKPDLRHRFFPVKPRRNIIAA